VTRAPLILVLLLGATACRREKREFSGLAPGAVPALLPASGTLVPAGATTVTAELREQPRPMRGYEETAYDVSQGQQLFMWFNCNGCHGRGGGGMGVALMDGQWRYGSAPDVIFSSIVEGRPNGMPAFRGKIPTRQVWQLVAYVRSLSGLVRKDAVAGRPDSMHATPPPPIAPSQRPVLADGGPS
jgi:cytochrome c oxidase cbb3-type subunit III